MTTARPQQRYIGDGVYASFDGYQIILETQNGHETTNRIALENEVLQELDQYRQYVIEFYSETQDEHRENQE